MLVAEKSEWGVADGAKEASGPSFLASSPFLRRH